MTKRNAAGELKYQQMWEVTGEVIRNWDPYELLSGVAPSDEWDAEIASVVAKIPRMQSPSDASAAISLVFTSSLGASFTPEDCSGVGAELFARLRERGLV